MRSPPFSYVRNGDFHEPLNTDGPPNRWIFDPADCVAISFRLDADVSGACGCIRWREKTQSRGAWVIADAEPQSQADRSVANDAGTYWIIEIPPPNRETVLEYELGYVTDGRAVTWGDVARTLVFAPGPRRSTDLGYSRELGGPEATVEITPAPENWRRRLFYSVIVDRFATREGDLDPLEAFVPRNDADPFSSHGGTINGLCDRLEYLKALGVGALIVNPLYINEADGYHGYHPLSLYHVEPRIGTLSDFQALVRAAHDRNIAVLLDVIANHMGPSLLWERDDEEWRGHFRLIDPGETTPMLVPEDFRTADHFNPPGGEGLIGTPLFGFLDDWKTEKPAVRSMLIEHIKYWIANTNIDGVRCDAVRHVDLAFWEKCVSEVRGYSEAIGKSNFIILGEHASEHAEDVGVYSKAGNFTGMIDYPLFYRFRTALAERTAPLSIIDEYLRYDVFSYRDSRWNLAFIDNQDTTRFFAHCLEHIPDRDQARLMLQSVLALVILGPEIPCIYYGTEQEFSGALGNYLTEVGIEYPYDIHVREDMFENESCAWASGKLNRKRWPAYDTSNPTFQSIRLLSDLRQSHPAIHSGNRTAVFDGSDGVLVFKMQTEACDEEVIIAVNLNIDGEATTRELEGENVAQNPLFSFGTNELFRTENGVQITIAPCSSLAFEI